MTRVALKQGEAPARVLSEEEFINEIAALEAAGFRGAAPGPVTVEALDEDGRVCWRGYYTSVERLAQLAHQLVLERGASRT
jgi:hypothetical protein